MRLEFDDPLFNLATVLIAGIVGGELFALLRMPKVTGWITTGIILRALRLPGMNVDLPESLNDFTPLMNFVLGFIAFTVGATLYLASLRNVGRRIGFLLLCEALITPGLVTVGIWFVGGLWSDVSWKSAVLLGVIAICGAPGTTVLLVQEVRARGTLSKTLIAAIGLLDMMAVGVFVFAATSMTTEAHWAAAMQQVAVQFLVTMAIGGVCAIAALTLIHFVVSPAFLGPTMVAVILAAWGAAASLGTSGSILACTFAGIAVTNVRHDVVRSTEAYLHAIGGVLFALFFTLAGMRLDFSQVPAMFGLVILYFVSRLIGKVTSSYLAMTLAGMTTTVRKYLGVALLPHGGVAVGLILLVQSEPAFEEVQSLITTVGLSALAINQLLGPSATRFALTQAGEVHRDRPQLLEFLQEYRIKVGLNGTTREAVIRELSALLYATSEMHLPQGEFVEKVLARERLETTCLGKGLMIPHAFLDEGQEVKGVLGISPRGLDLGAQDGLVHAVLLLATPEGERERHLQILAAVASAITRDANFSEQLYHARNAAHAYDVLHHEDQEDLNYFLEDAAERAGLRAATDSSDGRR